MDKEKRMVGVGLVIIIIVGLLLFNMNKADDSNLSGQATFDKTVVNEVNSQQALIADNSQIDEISLLALEFGNNFHVAIFGDEDDSGIDTGGDDDCDNVEDYCRSLTQNAWNDCLDKCMVEVARVCSQEGAPADCAAIGANEAIEYCAEHSGEAYFDCMEKQGC